MPTRVENGFLWPHTYVRIYHLLGVFISMFTACRGGSNMYIYEFLHSLVIAAAIAAALCTDA